MSIKNFFCQDPGFQLKSDHWSCLIVFAESIYGLVFSPGKEKLHSRIAFRSKNPNTPSAICSRIRKTQTLVVSEFKFKKGGTTRVLTGDRLSQYSKIGSNKSLQFASRRVGKDRYLLWPSTSRKTRSWYSVSIIFKLYCLQIDLTLFCWKHSRIDIGAKMGTDWPIIVNGEWDTSNAYN